MKSLRPTAVGAALGLAVLTGVGPANAATRTPADILRAGATAPLCSATSTSG
ncbi:hypothetical protein [Kitasatospora sp. GP82]|uniref:hypothetical protein n=1 Tax=Kitasatospora sp. GP82 TaxID=3035089 RepID=UPI002475F650|nr:hypothetical protein [Kitasatospora sp. GP82]MDH6127405.1 hypothetical protein [Kitasatospora sp. GP82]